MPRAHTFRIVASVVLLALLSVSALAHDTDHHAVTEEILEELQALRDDFDALLGSSGVDDGVGGVGIFVGVDLSGTWEVSAYRRCTGNLPRRVLSDWEHTPYVELEITQHGNQVAVAQYAGRWLPRFVQSYTGTIFGKTFQYAYDDVTDTVRITGTATIAATHTQADVTEQIQGTIDGVQVDVTCESTITLAA